jgi:hypothetical protein
MSASADSVPGTKINEDRECATYDLKKKSISSGLLTLGKWATSSRIGEDKYTKSESDDEDNFEPRDKSFFRKIKKRKDKNYPSLLKFNLGLKYSIFISRHANSCNNIAEDYQYFSKSQDPSLSFYGLSTLSPKLNPNRPQKIIELGKDRKALNKDVYVSCCIRTWQTAILIYGNEERDSSNSYKLRLFVSPYIKEEGIDDGNLPQSLDLQNKKIDSWIESHTAEGHVSKNCSVEIYMSFFDTSRQDEQIYPVLQEPFPVYDTQHLTYFPDGILFFSKWVTDHIQSLNQKKNYLPNGRIDDTFILGGKKSRKKQYKKKLRSSSRHK